MTSTSLPLVSIVTPTYNQAEYLASTIDSVLSQTYPRLQYIILDDGSTDSTCEVLRRYNGRVHWSTHSNMGQARTLNKGWSLSDGQIFGYLSSDDILGPTAVVEAVHCLLDNPEAAVAYSDYFLIDSHGTTFREVRVEDFSIQRLRQELICQPGPGAFFRRSVFDQCKGWRPDLEQTPDFDFWLRASVLGEFKRVPKPLAYCRVHAQSASYRPISRKRAIEVIDVVKTFWESLDQNCPAAALAKAYLVAGKLHLQSGRYAAGLKCLADATQLSPTVALSAAGLRTLFAGLLRNSVYRVSGRHL